MLNSKLVLFSCSLLFLITSCGGEKTISSIDSTTTSTTTSNTSSSSDEITSDNSSTPISQEPSKKIVTIDFSTDKPQGYLFDDHVDEFKDIYFSDSLFSSISLFKMQAFQCEEKDIYHTIQLGSAKHEGTLNIETTKLIKEIELTFVNYYNAYEISGESYSNVYDVSLYIKDNDNDKKEDFTLSKDNELLEPKTVQFEMNTKSFTISTYENPRCLLLGMKLTYLE